MGALEKTSREMTVTLLRLRWNQAPHEARLGGCPQLRDIAAYFGLIGERAYVTLSLLAKSLLAWQVFASTLASNAAQ